MAEAQSNVICNHASIDLPYHFIPINVVLVARFNEGIDNVVGLPFSYLEQNILGMMFCIVQTCVFVNIVYCYHLFIVE